MSIFCTFWGEISIKKSKFTEERESERERERERERQTDRQRDRDTERSPQNCRVTVILLVASWVIWNTHIILKALIFLLIGCVEWGVGIRFYRNLISAFIDIWSCLDTEFAIIFFMSCLYSWLFHIIKNYFLKNKRLIRVINLKCFLN